MSSHSHAAPSTAVQSSHDEEHHIVGIPVYIGVFLTLIVLTWVTTWVSTVDLGPLNIYVALSIAVFKASLVIFFFMHLKWATKLVKFVVATGFVWLLMLLFIVMVDIWTRTWMGVPGR